MGEERIPQVQAPDPTNPILMAQIIQELQRDVLDILEAVQNDRYRDWLRL